MNRKYEKTLFVIVILLIGLAFLPLLTDSFVQSYSWKEFASAYQKFLTYIPIVLR